jgi:hypothetical protein
MGGASGTRRWLLRSRWPVRWLALAPLLWGCESPPVAQVAVSPQSSVLAVDVVFPVALGRDPSLVQTYLVKGPVGRGGEEIQELLTASFVKKSRAYLLDPEPGTYSLVAVSCAVAAPLNDRPVAGGVTRTTLRDTIADTVILPAGLIRRTRTTVGPGDVAFMGALRVRVGKRINASSLPEDELQARIADRIRPGATSEAGLSGWFTLTWTADPEQTALGDEEGDWKAFLVAAQTDLGSSPWARVIAGAAPAAEADSEAGAAEPGWLPAAAEAAAPEPRSPAAAAAPAAAGPLPQDVARAARPQSAAPQAPAPGRDRRRVPGIPADSPLAQIEIGMRYEDVERILGAPDARLDRITAKAWIPFYTGPGAYLRDWVYAGRGRVVFSRHAGTLEVIDVVHDPDARE